MPRIFGELKDATFENLSSDPASNVAGRFWQNTTEGKIKTDNGTNKRALLRNDDKLVIGNSGTANDNVRANRAAPGVLQFLFGGNATAEGALSATQIAELSSRLENYPDASKPAAGNPGRLIWVSDLLEVQYDNGTTWLSIAGASGGWGALGSATLNSNTVLTSGDSKRIYQCDSSGGAFTIQLPSPTSGFLITVTDLLGTFDKNPVTLTRSSPSDQIQNLASDYILQAPYGSWNLYSDGSNYFFA